MRHLFLAVCGVVASASLASAQGTWSPAPLGPPTFPRQTVSPASMSVSAPAGGCSTCGAAAAPAGPFAGLHSRFANSPLTIGRGCANNPGCGSFASERTFLFGGCNQFFNAGNKCGGGGCGSGYGPGGMGDGSVCKYGSYLNR
jgi:hypothetical protein